MEEIKYYPDSGGVVMGIDFGKSESTGIAVFENKELIYCGQFDRNEFKKEISKLMENFKIEKELFPR